KIKEIGVGDSEQSPTTKWEYSFDGNIPEMMKVEKKISNCGNNFSGRFSKIQVARLNSLSR
ncbi:MAG: hypothetical protein KKH52_03510, partial [Nanoarchaeota archaeon]|nr:hypothetical protein [Nanoarchaeota archaeon]